MANETEDMIELGSAWLAATQFLACIGICERGEPVGCWEAQVDDRWWIAFNSSADLRVTSDGVPVVGFAILVKRDGRSVGVLDPSGHVSFPQEREFIDDVRRATPQ